MTYYGAGRTSTRSPPRKRGSREPGPRNRSGRLSVRGREGKLGPRELRSSAVGRCPRASLGRRLDRRRTAAGAPPTVGHDFNALKQAAAWPDFKPVALNAKARFEITNTLRDVQSKNVVSRVEGTTRSSRTSSSFIQAHWDHLGRDSGARATRSSTARPTTHPARRLAGTGPAFSQVRPGSRRSILFLAVTAEEKGLLGAKYYATHPLSPWSGPWRTSIWTS